MSCTGFPEGCWSDCCANHDDAYRQQSGKFKADMELYRCVKSKNHRWISVIMLIGVSTFGWLFYWRARFK